jgi:lysyl-tRNA synthetase class 2
MTNNIGQIISDVEWTKTSVMARVISFRKMGNIAFATIQDAFGKIQIVLKKDVTPDYKNICSSIRSGVHIFAYGDRFITTSGELSILASDIKVKQSQASGLPDKIDGVSNPETIGRRRYVATATDLDHAKIFLTRFKIINQIRNFLINKYDFDFLKKEFNLF